FRTRILRKGIVACSIPTADTCGPEFCKYLNIATDFKGLAGLDSYSNKYIVRSTHCVLEDEEVTVCYGAHDNARLWMEYGFTLPNNPNGRVIIEIALFIALAKSVGVAVSSQHEEVLSTAGLPCSLYLSDEGPSWALRTNFHRLQATSCSCRKRWSEFVYGSSALYTTADRDAEVDLKETNERQLLEKIIIELKQAVTAKLTAVCAPEDIKWIWQEQLMIIDATLSYFTH
uniref:SET domain-containing protein n=1 Tax=Angiostrongylus cantonensis TaxID=6313 RepID=A0A0K0DM60_ANGCA